MGKKYQDQINRSILLTCHIDLLGSPLGANPEDLHLIVPFELNPKKWLQMHWIDQYSGKKFRTTRENNLQQSSHRAGKNLWRYFTEYKHHPESKWADEYGNVCDRQTAGLLYR